MQFKHLLLASAFTFTAACSADPEAVQPPSESIPALDIVATHAIFTSSAVSGVSFLDNETAAWLGGILLISQDGGLSITDIEGENVMDIAQDVRAVAGLKSGLFLAAATDGTLQTFLQKTDLTTIGSISLSGNSEPVSDLCANPQAGNTKAIALGKAEENSRTVSGLKFDAVPTSSAIAEYTVKDKFQVSSEAYACAALGDDVYVLYHEGDGTLIKGLREAVNNEALINSKLNGLAAIDIGGQDYLLSVSNGKVLLIDAPTLKPVRILKIGDGLSIQGLETAKFVAATHANYGGGAFNEGFITIGDADTQRLVFISRSYLAQQLSSVKAE